MRQYPANDLEYDSLPELPNLLEPEEPPAPFVQEEVLPPSPSNALISFQNYCDKLMTRATVRPGNKRTDDQYKWARLVLRQVFPGPYYPSNLREADKKSFDDYIKGIPSLEATITASLKTSTSQRSEGHAHVDQEQPSDKGISSSPTFLSMSQKIYDAETSRRESINTRCAAVLGTAGILGTLVVAAGQLGLTLRSGPANSYTWTVLVFFLMSLVYIGYAISLALHVHGDIQGEVIDWNNLNTCNPKQTLDAYNFSVSLPLLTYSHLNWCLNNNLKHRLHSAGRSLRNGVIAVIVAGALSPWAITSSTNNATDPAGAQPLATLVVSS